MKAALINNSGTVENIVVWDDTCVAPNALTAIVLDDTAIVNIGWVYNGSSFIDPNPISPPVIVPSSITRPQAAKQLLFMGLISGAEAVAMVTVATPPAMLMSLISALVPEDQVTAQIDFARYTYDRDYPLLNQLMTAAGKTSTDVDNFFIAAAIL
jgi:hypothetical protein